MIFCKREFISHTYKKTNDQHETYIHSGKGRVKVPLKGDYFILLLLRVNRSSHVFAQPVPGFDEVGV
jgi:hypothetical protein